VKIFEQRIKPIKNPQEDSDSPQVSLVYAMGMNMGHSVWSEISGIEILTKINIKNTKIISLVLGEFDFFQIGNIFQNYLLDVDIKRMKNNEACDFINNGQLTACQIIGNTHTKEMRQLVPRKWSG
jgi:hypothetical protein